MQAAPLATLPTQLMALDRQQSQELGPRHRGADLDKAPGAGLAQLRLLQSSGAKPTDGRSLFLAFSVSAQLPFEHINELLKMLSHIHSYHQSSDKIGKHFIMNLKKQMTFSQCSWNDG